MLSSKYEHNAPLKVRIKQLATNPFMRDMNRSNPNYPHTSEVVKLNSEFKSLTAIIWTLKMDDLNTCLHPHPVQVPKKLIPQDRSKTNLTLLKTWPHSWLKIKLSRLFLALKVFTIKTSSTWSSTNCKNVKTTIFSRRLHKRMTRL